ncbi:hypothetical protein X943_003982 [Babesia divergens]|uniref:Aminomethyltransferase folate-binding domain-containing protein n=1 Tax=Babesia divergens TaxID=32595 RepID=A0AAD9GLJ9_BABDI|nr:hypothetical protein X943_003982 [Babesia divergens]
MLSRLSGRSVLALSGSDSFTFLQGLISNDLTRLNNTKNMLLKCVFLGSDGRIQADGLITRQADYYTVETGRGNLECLLTLLKRRKLSSKVEYKVIEDCSVYCKVPNWLLSNSRPGEAEEKPPNDPLDSTPEFTCDMPLLSRRYAVSSGLQEVKDYSSTHRLYLALNGFGVTLIDELKPLKVLPQDLSLHKLGFISNNKGCYVGQEIMNRLLNRTLTHKYNLNYIIRGEHLEKETKDSIKEVPVNDIAIGRVLVERVGELSAMNILRRVITHDVREVAHVDAESKVVPIVYYSTGFGLALLPQRGPVRNIVLVDGEKHMCYPV